MSVNKTSNSWLWDDKVFKPYWKNDFSVPINWEVVLTEKEFFDRSYYLDNDILDKKNIKFDEWITFYIYWLFNFMTWKWCFKSN